MTTIIRIEHPFSGWGLFKAFNKEGYDIIDNVNCWDALSLKHLDFPSPSADKGLRNLQKDEFCAFKTVEQLQDWIEPSWMEEIISLGFKILMLDVSECRIGEYQILFKKENILQTKDITSLFINN